LLKTPREGGRGYQADGGRFDREIGCLVIWKVIVAFQPDAGEQKTKQNITLAAAEP
jgi:hypothetical protein